MKVQHMKMVKDLVYGILSLTNFQVSIFLCIFFFVSISLSLFFRCLFSSRCTGWIVHYDNDKNQPLYILICLNFLGVAGKISEGSNGDVGDNFYHMYKVTYVHLFNFVILFLVRRELFGFSLFKSDFSIVEICNRMMLSSWSLWGWMLSDFQSHGQEYCLVWPLIIS